MKEFQSGGKKDTAGKLPLHLVPPEVVEIFAKVTQVGIDKGYEPRNWEKGLPIMEGHLAAAERHMLRYKKGENTNTETLKDGSVSNLHHLEHAAWHLIAAAVQINRNRVDLDDRTIATTGNQSTARFVYEGSCEIRFPIKEEDYPVFKHTNFKWGNPYVPTEQYLHEIDPDTAGSF